MLYFDARRYLLMPRLAADAAMLLMLAAATPMLPCCRYAEYAPFTLVTITPFRRLDFIHAMIFT